MKWSGLFYYWIMEMKTTTLRLLEGIMVTKTHGTESIILSAYLLLPLLPPCSCCCCLCLRRGSSGGSTGLAVCRRRGGDIAAAVVDFVFVFVFVVVFVFTFVFVLSLFLLLHADKVVVSHLFPAADIGMMALSVAVAIVLGAVFPQVETKMAPTTATTGTTNERHHGAPSTPQSDPHPREGKGKGNEGEGGSRPMVGGGRDVLHYEKLW
jgi:hypothetical protein